MRVRLSPGTLGPSSNREDAAFAMQKSEFDSPRVHYGTKQTIKLTTKASPTAQAKIRFFILCSSACWANQARLVFDLLSFSCSILYRVARSMVVTVYAAQAEMALRPFGIREMVSSSLTGSSAFSAFTITGS